MSYSPPSTAHPLAVDQRAVRAPGWRWYYRGLMVLTGCVLVGLLGTAAVLRPNPLGMGTHRQLGLPPCSLVALAGMRCPSCGMTTSWAHMVRGNVIGAVRANSGGAMLAVAALLSGPWLVVSGLRGRWALWQPRESVVLAVGLTIVAITLIDWCMRLNWGH